MTAFCCYCGVARPRTEMRSVTTSIDLYKEWCMSLGPTFDINRREVTKGYICLGHFSDYTKFSIPKPHPFWCPDTDKMKRHRSSVPVDPNNQLPEKRLCCYCGDSKRRTQLRSVTKRPDLLKQWCDVLGEEFVMRLQRYVKGFICRCHFPDENRQSIPKPLPFIRQINFEEEGEEDDDDDDLHESMEIEDEVIF